MRRFIRAEGIRGNCDFCGSSRHKVIRPIELRGLFEPVLELYQPAQAGRDFSIESNEGGFGFESLGYLMQDDWNVFNEDVDADELLDAIRLSNCRPGEEGPESSDGWNRIHHDHFSMTAEQTWDWFADHVKTQSRFMIDRDDSGEIVRPETWLRDAIEHQQAVRIITPSTKLYRGRKGYVQGGHPHGGRQPFPADQMGAPPAHLATASRASCHGIPMFYAAMDSETAIAESGRFPGATVSVRKVKAVRDLRVVDLSKYRGVTDPFDATDLVGFTWYAGLLNRLNLDLSRPIHPDDSAIDYLPTQYLAEAIRSLGYDGICFQSALTGEGTNVVIFNPADMRVVDGKSGHLAEIESVKFKIKEWT